MICQDCAAAADLADAERDGVQLVTRSTADHFEAGHDRCVVRNLGRAAESQDCMCQHRAVSDG